MTATVRRFEFDSQEGEAVIHIDRSRAMSLTQPAKAEDVPEDIRVALRKWLDEAEMNKAVAGAARS